MLISGPKVIEWMREQDRGFRHLRDDMPALGWNDGKGMVAGVVYTDFNGANINMHVIAVPGKRWLRREYLWACFDYPFNQCKVRRVTGLVGSDNKQARVFDEHLGFEHETTLARAHPTGDLIVYVMWKERCRWLSLDYSHKYRKAA